MPRKNLWESWSLPSASDDSCAAVNIVKYGMPWEKFSIMCIAQIPLGLSRHDMKSCPLILAQGKSHDVLCHACLAARRDAHITTSVTSERSNARSISANVALTDLQQTAVQTFCYKRFVNCIGPCTTLKSLLFCYCQKRHWCSSEWR